MSEPAAWVYVDLGGTPRLAGRLWTRIRGGRESASFEYADTWRGYDGAFALSPALGVGLGAYHTPAGRPVLAALGDSAPDRWGRTLLARHERLTARREDRAPRTLREIDYLLGVSDVTRQGALRFALEEGGPFVASRDRKAAPSLVRLPELLSATRSVLAEREDSEELRLLMAPGSSLGGARPKASVVARDGSLLIAKFPAEQDEYDLVRWEAVALTLAGRAGIDVPGWRLESVLDRQALLLERFDRRGEVRVPYLSAMSMLDAADGDVGSYMDIADALRMHGAEARKDLRQLWRRLAFNILVSNTDDHLRNHGFLYAGNGGWRLSPAFDLNPVPVDLKPRILSTAIDATGDRTASLETALEVAESFGLKADEAADIAREVGRAVAEWRGVARQLGAPAAEIERMESAFEHEDAERARG